LNATSIQTTRSSVWRQHGLALPAALLITAVVLVTAVAMIRASREDVSGSGNIADRAFAAEATDAALKALMTEVQTLPAIPELTDPVGTTLAWWNTSLSAVNPAFWSNCATASPGARCTSESITRSGRTYTVQRTVQPSGVPDENSGTSGAISFFYRASVLVTLDNGTRAEVEGYVRRPQLVRN
jgi:Tfp pilus assembly protein PilX